MVRFLLFLIFYIVVAAATCGAMFATYVKNGEGKADDMTMCVVCGSLWPAIIPLIIAYELTMKYLNKSDRKSDD